MCLERPKNGASRDLIRASKRRRSKIWRWFRSHHGRSHSTAKNSGRTIVPRTKRFRLGFLPRSESARSLYTYQVKKVFSRVSRNGNDGKFDAVEVLRGAVTL